MRFRSFLSFPSFTGYVEGHSFGRTLAYGIAAGLDKGLNRFRDPEPGRRALRKLFYRIAMMKDGILPWPGEKKVRPKVASATSVAALVQTPVVAARPAPVRHLMIPPGTRLNPVVLPRHSVCTPASQRYPAAVSKTGGLRGSTATKRWR